MHCLCDCSPSRTFCDGIVHVKTRSLCGESEVHLLIIVRMPREASLYYEGVHVEMNDQLQ